MHKLQVIGKDMWVIVKKSSPKNLLADCRSTVGRQTADRFCPKYRLPVGRQWTDSRPTGFLGSSSSQLPICGLIPFNIFLKVYARFVYNTCGI